MKLDRTLPKLGALPEILVFHCAGCNEVETAGDLAAPGVEGRLDQAKSSWGATI
jgi:hypothetical protein